MSEIIKSSARLNSVSPTEELQRLRVEEAARAVGGVKKLESAGFFELAGIDPNILNDRKANNEIENPQTKGLTVIETEKKRIGQIAASFPCLRQPRLEDC